MTYQNLPKHARKLVTTPDRRFSSVPGVYQDTGHYLRAVPISGGTARDPSRHDHDTLQSEE